MLLLGRIDGVKLSFVTALAIVVHATVVLALQQIIATPLHYVHESLTSPTTIAGLLQMFDEGSWPSRLFGSIDVFVQRKAREIAPAEIRHGFLE